jgi:hypothetical protein
VKRVSAPAVWVAKDDGTDFVRAEAMAGVGRDYNGAITTRLAGHDDVAVTLVMPDAQEGPDTPVDFHRQLIRVVAELSATAEAVVVRPVCTEPNGWRWITEPL